MCLQGTQINASSEEEDGKVHEFNGMVNEIMDDGEVDYKKAFELRYWLEENKEVAKEYQELFYEMRITLEDGSSIRVEEKDLKSLLRRSLT